MEGTGFTPADYEIDDFELWPDNWTSFDVFCEVRTQWRTGMNGREGLDYNVLFRLLDDRHEDKAEWKSAFQDIQVMELEALKVFSERQ